MIRTLACALACAALAAAPEARALERPQDVARAAAAPVQAAVRREGDRWSVDLALDRDAPVWAFENTEALRDGRSWRLAQWTVETPGVVLETVEGRDVLRAADGGDVPRRVRIRMEPRFVDLQSNYDPVLTFSTGAVAWYSESFNLLPLASPEALIGLPGDLGPLVHASGYASVAWSDAGGPVLFRGERQGEPSAVHPRTYMLLGPAAIVESGPLTTVTDPGLPAWIATELAAYAPRVTDYYALRLGPRSGGTPTVMMSWTGPTPGEASMAGSVLPELVVMAFEGDGVLEPSVGVRNLARWFIGHESAHFWLGETVRYESPADSWITEGGADLTAVRALQAVDPTYGGKGRLQAAVDDCTAMADEPVVTSVTRGEFQAHYACGAVFALAAEAAQKRATGGDWFDFLRGLIDASRADGVLTRDEWLTALTAVSGDPELRRDMEMLLDEGASDPGAVLRRLFDRSGVVYRLEAGEVVLG